MALSFIKVQVHKAGSNFLFTGSRYLILNFCTIIIFANLNIIFNYLSEINITIEGTGRQQILSDDSAECGGIAGSFNSLPNETLVNGVPQNISGKYVDNLVNQTNIITLRWNYQVTTCDSMFYDLKNITSIELSNFDTSKVEIFECMFFNCTSLKSINLNNVNTSSANNMRSMFSGCTGLETFNLSSFDTSKVTSMWDMFYGCTSLKSLDLSNFETPEIEEINGMFYSCSSLVLLNIINFNISNVYNSYWMFYKVNRNLIYCATESTIAKIKSSSQESYIENYNNNCTHSCFLNSQSKYIIEKNECIDDCSKDKNYSYEYNNTCYKSCPNRTHISPNNDYLCEDDLICANYYNYDKTECFNEIPEGFYLNDSNSKILYKCDNKCKNCSFKSTMQGKCISCNISAGYYPLYNNDTNNETYISCYNESIEGYALFNFSYMPCFRSCHNCSEIGDEKNNKCIYCKSNYEFKKEMNETQNCYEKCDNDSYYYFDNFSNYNCTMTKECPDKYKLIKEKGKCIDDCSKDNLYKYEYNNNCYLAYPEISNKAGELLTNISHETIVINNIINKCTIYELSNGLCKLEIYNNDNNNMKEKDDIVSYIRELISKGRLDSILLNKTNENNKGVVIKDESTVYQIVSTENQNNSREDNISIIELSECENDLRSHYNISKKDSLLIFKMDIYEEGSITPRIEYEVYDSKSKTQLDLSICNHIKINILVPAVIDKDDINKYNSSHEYYNDICYTYTTDNGTDIILADRKNEFISNNMSLCESKCEYGGYDADIKKAKCECEVKIKIPLMSEITINSNILKKKIDIKNALNIKVMKCYKNAFSAKGLKGNIGSYIILSFIFAVSICQVLFLIKGFSVVKGYINSVNSCKNPNDNIITKRPDKKVKKKKRKENKIKNVNINFLNPNIIINNEHEVKDNKKKNNRFKRNKVEPPLKKKPKRNKVNNNNIRNIRTSGEETLKGKTSYIGLANYRKDKIIKLNVEPLKDITKKKTQNNNNKNNIINKNNNINNNNNLIKTKYNDYELNNLNYKQAIIIDKRNYFQYYLSLLKRKHILIFTFYTSNDYNSREIKICLFIFSFALYFTVNALFFNDSTMHKIYEENGTFNFIYHLPQIVYSTLISSAINMIATFLSLSEKAILEFKAKNSKNRTKQSVVNKLIIKFILFFVLIYILLILFWYYLVCFCAVYINTQIHLVKDTLISYTLYLLYPFGLCLLPGSFRIPSLASKKANKECIYKLSKIIQLI